jgi:hypothetical protein
MIKPITPEEAAIANKDYQIGRIPNFVVAAVNRLLTQNYNKTYITLLQKEILHAIAEEVQDFSEEFREQLFANKWLDFEPYFREHGWVVEYDRPGYNESYEPCFTFKPKR